MLASLKAYITDLQTCQPPRSEKMWIVLAQEQRFENVQDSI